MSHKLLIFFVGYVHSDSRNAQDKSVQCLIYVVAIKEFVLEDSLIAITGLLCGL